jgi:hypothetical protein
MTQKCSEQINDVSWGLGVSYVLHGLPQFLQKKYWANVFTGNMTVSITSLRIHDPYQEMKTMVVTDKF